MAGHDSASLNIVGLLSPAEIQTTAGGSVALPSRGAGLNAALDGLRIRSIIPFNDEGWRHGRATAITAINGQAADRQFIRRHDAVQIEKIRAGIRQDLPQQLALDGGVRDIAISPASSAQVTQRSSGIVRVVREEAGVDAYAIKKEAK